MAFARNALSLVDIEYHRFGTGYVFRFDCIGVEVWHDVYIYPAFIGLYLGLDLNFVSN